MHTHGRPLSELLHSKRMYDAPLAEKMHEIAVKGTAIYERLKTQYGPNDKGKYLAIETGDEKAYIGETGVEALELARAAHPDKLFYVVKIGYDSTETLSETIFGAK